MVPRDSALMVQAEVRISQILHCLSSLAVYTHFPSLLKPILFTVALWASGLEYYGTRCTEGIPWGFACPNPLRIS